MNNKKTFWIAALALILLIGGAYSLYESLGDELPSDNLITTPTTATTTAAEDTAVPQSPTLMPAPDFTVYDAQGNAVTLSSMRGKPVILNFWASWCGPCKGEMPDFEAAYKLYGDDIHFMMVNCTDGVRETVADADTFIQEQGYTFPVYYDNKQDAANTYSIYSVPMTYFIDTDGIVKAQGRGALTADVLQKGIDLLRPAANNE